MRGRRELLLGSERKARADWQAAKVRILVHSQMTTGATTSGRSATTRGRRPQSAARRLLPAGVFSLLLVTQLVNYPALGAGNLFRLGVAVTPDRIAGVMVFVLLAVGFARGSLRPFNFGAVGWCFLLLALVCTVSWGVAGSDAGSESYRWLTTLWNLIYLPFGVFLLAKNARYDRTRLQGLLLTIVCVGAYLAITAAAEHFRLTQLVWPKYILDPDVGIQFGRARGPFVSSVTMGEWLIVAFLGVCLVLRIARARLAKLSLSVLVLAVTAAIYFTDTRSVWASFAMVLGIIALFGGALAWWPRRVVALVVVVFVVGIGAKLSIYEQTLFSRRQSTVDYRVANAKTLFAMGVANPWVGVGYGNFLREYPNYFRGDSLDLTPNLGDGNHNTYLGLFAETGISGFALYVALYICALVECLRARKSLSSTREFESAVALVSGCLVCVAIFEAGFSDIRFNPTFNTVVFLFVGTAASAGRSAAEPVEEPGGGRGKKRSEPRSRT